MAEDLVYLSQELVAVLEPCIQYERRYAVEDYRSCWGRIASDHLIQDVQDDRKVVARDHDLPRVAVGLWVRALREQEEPYTLDVVLQEKVDWTAHRCEDGDSATGP